MATTSMTPQILSYMEEAVDQLPVSRQTKGNIISSIKATGTAEEVLRNFPNLIKFMPQVANTDPTIGTSIATAAGNVGVSLPDNYNLKNFVQKTFQIQGGLSSDVTLQELNSFTQDAMNKKLIPQGLLSTEQLGVSVTPGTYTTPCSATPIAFTSSGNSMTDMLSIAAICGASCGTDLKKIQACLGTFIHIPQGAMANQLGISLPPSVAGTSYAPPAGCSTMSFMPSGNMIIDTLNVAAMCASSCTTSVATTACIGSFIPKEGSGPVTANQLGVSIPSSATKSPDNCGTITFTSSGNSMVDMLNVAGLCGVNCQVAGVAGGYSAVTTCIGNFITKTGAATMTPNQLGVSIVSSGPYSPTNCGNSAITFTNSNNMVDMLNVAAGCAALCTSSTDIRGCLGTFINIPQGAMANQLGVSNFAPGGNTGGYAPPSGCSPIDFRPAGNMMIDMFSVAALCATSCDTASTVTGCISAFIPPSGGGSIAASQLGLSIPSSATKTITNCGTVPITFTSTGNSMTDMLNVAGLCGKSCTNAADVTVCIGNFITKLSVPASMTPNQLGVNIVPTGSYNPTGCGSITFTNSNNMVDMVNIAAGCAAGCDAASKIQVCLGTFIHLPKGAMNDQLGLGIIPPQAPPAGMNFMPSGNGMMDMLNVAALCAQNGANNNNAAVTACIGSFITNTGAGSISANQFGVAITYSPSPAPSNCNSLSSFTSSGNGMTDMFNVAGLCAKSCVANGGVTANAAVTACIRAFLPDASTPATMTSSQLGMVIKFALPPLNNCNGLASFTSSGNSMVDMLYVAGLCAKSCTLSADVTNCIDAFFD